MQLLNLIVHQFQYTSNSPHLVQSLSRKIKLLILTPKQCCPELEISGSFHVSGKTHSVSDLTTMNVDEMNYSHYATGLSSHVQKNNRYISIHNFSFLPLLQGTFMIKINDCFASSDYDVFTCLTGR